jgi:transposase
MPVYLSCEDHINAHFLICFIALTVARLLEIRLRNQFSIMQIADSLARVSCSPLEENWYLFDFRDEVTDAIYDVMDINLNRKYLTLGEIKYFIGATKK